MAFLPFGCLIPDIIIMFTRRVFMPSPSDKIMLEVKRNKLGNTNERTKRPQQIHVKVKPASSSINSSLLEGGDQTVHSKSVIVDSKSSNLRRNTQKFADPVSRTIAYNANDFNTIPQSKDIQRGNHSINMNYNSNINEKKNPTNKEGDVSIEELDHYHL